MRKLDSIFKEIDNNIATSMSSDRKAWAKKIVDEQLSLEPIITMLSEDHPKGARASYVLGDICEIAPSRLVPYLVDLFNNRYAIDVLGFDRSLAKFFKHSGVPNEIEGEVLDQLIKWMSDSGIKVGTKYYSMYVLRELCNKYPEITNEFVAILEDQKERNTKTFKRMAIKILSEMKKADS
ncbi:hypothetical protein [Aureibacter tunicatorum]|uniref:Uncharacterized protein n=1 Tax=Aureibacter tunicatorum TaxID=866807 RepID=A0AAE3XPD9_9BACT|nr:hypothetical protein [Aureibacter tunicatorum]MDR6240258.1 hypothetical protein [Aureibacter tunicatorum]BDD05861.1 hypothetical protein AUTU_33440 [Aureibacter tunicatorum]